MHEKRAKLLAGGHLTSNEGSPRQKPTKYKKKYETVLHQNELLELKIQQLTKDMLHMKASEKTAIGWVFIVLYDRTSIRTGEHPIRRRR